MISHSYEELREKLAERRRGLQKAPLKKQVAIRFSPEVLDYFRATGKGWQTRMDAALREWIHDHPQAV
ncbi:MAG: BrnA antitoxin family protein [Candidatus Contendobacter sp.]|nr:BrnA antitoxin family protein [Candidatus Contendobacter sp.]